MEKQKVNELLDNAANDYASENRQHDLSAQYSAFIAGAYFFINQSIKNRFKVFLLSLTFNFKKKKEEKRNTLYRCRRLRYPTMAMEARLENEESKNKQMTASEKRMYNAEQELEKIIIRTNDYNFINTWNEFKSSIKQMVSDSLH